MNARQRNIQTIESFGSIKFDHHPRFHLTALIAKHGLAALTDAAVAELAQSLVDSKRRQDAIAEQSKKRRESTVPK